MDKEFKLQRIVLFNMFNYRGRHVIDFTTTRPGNIFLFNVKNGGGKTSLFMSMKWGFYGFDNGVRYVKNGVALKGQDFMNKYEYGNGTYRVVIDFIFDGHPMQLRRECPDYHSEATELSIKVDGVVEHGDKAKERVLHILPPDYGDFMMFDGEILDKIALQQGDKNKTDNVMKLLGLSQLRELRVHLSNIQSSISSELARGESANYALKGLMNELDELQKKEKRYQEEYKAAKENLDDIQRKIWDKESERTAYIHIQSTVDELSKKTAELNTAKQERESTQSYIREHSTDAFLLFMEPDIRALKEKHEKKKSELRKESYFDGRVNNEFAHIQNQIITEHLVNCPVCSSKLSEDIIDHLNELMRQSKDKGELYRKHHAELTECTNAINFLQDQLSRIPKGLNDKCNKLYDISEKIDDIQARIEELNKIASESEVDAVRRITEELKPMYSERSRAEVTELKLSRFLENTKTNLMRTNNKIKDSGYLSTQQRTLSNRISHIEGLIKKLDMIIKKVSDSKRDDILAKANEVFRNITNKGDTYRGLQYDNNSSFSLHIVAKDGTAVPLISSGEAHVLAISFLISLCQNTERLTPLMMDTPLSRLDDVHKPNVGRTLASLSNQVIFLAQPGELDEDTEAQMMPSVAKLFIAEPTEDNSACIKEGEL